MVSQVSVSEGAIRHVECELQHYYETRRQIIQLQNEDLAQLPIVKNGRFNALRISTLRARHVRLSEMERVVTAIDAVMERLPAEKQELIKLRYWSGSPSWQTIAERLHCGPKIVKRWHDDVVYEIAQELGWCKPKQVPEKT